MPLNNTLSFRLREDILKWVEKIQTDERTLEAKLAELEEDNGQLWERINLMPYKVIQNILD